MHGEGLQTILRWAQLALRWSFLSNLVGRDRRLDKVQSVKRGWGDTRKPTDAATLRSAASSPTKTQWSAGTSARSRASVKKAGLRLVQAFDRTEQAQGGVENGRQARLSEHIIEGRCGLVAGVGDHAQCYREFVVPCACSEPGQNLRDEGIDVEPGEVPISNARAGECVTDVKEDRNALAHARRSFSGHGRRRYRIQDKMMAAVEIHPAGIWSNPPTPRSSRNGHPPILAAYRIESAPIADAIGLGWAAGALDDTTTAGTRASCPATRGAKAGNALPGGTINYGWRMIIAPEEYVDVKTPYGPMRTYVLRPAAAGRYPGLVLFSEIFQVTGPIRRTAAFLAGHGYTVAVPEIFHELEESPGVVLGLRRGGRRAGQLPQDH